MLLWTAHASSPDDVGVRGAADRSGLTALLGYRPMFCSRVDEGSLVETWFRLACAMPNFVDCVDVYDVDESDAVPLDAVRWAACALDDEPWPMSEDAIELCLSRGSSGSSTDWLLRPDAASVWHLDLHDVVSGRVSGLRETVRMATDAVSRGFVRVTSFDGRPMSVRDMSMEGWYRALMSVGFVPWAWSEITGGDVPMRLVYMGADAWHASADYGHYGALMGAWGASMAGGERFSQESFDEMRERFGSACDDVARRLTADMARRVRIGRNTACPCGSGRKFKRCCANKGMDALVTCAR